MKKKLTLIAFAAAVMALSALPFFSQANLRQPTVSTTGLLNVTWTAGTLNNGGHAVAITAGTLNATASKTDCAAPTYPSCDFVYADSSGTVAHSATLATAAASGNTIMAIIESSGTAITKMSFPLQNSGVGLAGLGVITSPTLVTPNIGAATGTSLDLTGSVDVGVAGTTVGTVVMHNATSGAITLTPTTGALGTVSATFPAASITVPGTTMTSCLTSATCATPTAQSTNGKIAYGSGALSSATPSVATISGISPAFTATTSMFCTASPLGTTATIAASSMVINLVSTSSFTVTGPDTVTTGFHWICVGN